MHIIEFMGPSQDLYWGMTSIQFFFMIQVSAACSALAAAQRAFGIKALEPYASFGLILGLGLGITAPLNLILELHQPLRFISMIYNTHFTSPLSWGVFILLSYMTVIALFALVILRQTLQQRHVSGSGSLATMIVRSGKTSEKSLRLLAYLALVAACCVFLYSSMDLAAVKGRDLWHSSIVPIIFICSAMAASAGLITLFAVLTGRKNPEHFKLLRGWMAFFLLLQLFAQVLWFLIAFVFGDSLGRYAFDYILSAGFQNFIVLGLGGAILLPMVLLYFSSQSKAMLLFASVLTLAGAYLVRWNIIVTGQQIPRSGLEMTPFSADLWSHGGLMQALAPLALWVLLMILVTWTSPWKQVFGQQQEGL
ncbi:Polysulphide reductase, NrfD [Desulfuromusa kysingii]|uniref:Polysulphide reductase, NrfD n=1 Tax=Desulfuromusa kysingii TaxID=37625 RepID=A0A1H4BF80_9BACT|nr:NrfD/PsrC family molybdoenzyme membrane anchor subunit [Desulfuromusa kysingii]SEA46462.1 Polysulphide reductase, NrfD [Desulfuromusa kysingii]